MPIPLQKLGETKKEPFGLFDYIWVKPMTVIRDCFHENYIAQNLTKVEVAFPY